MSCYLHVFEVVVAVPTVESGIDDDGDYAERNGAEVKDEPSVGSYAPFKL